MMLCNQGICGFLRCLQGFPKTGVYDHNQPSSDSISIIKADYYLDYSRKKDYNRFKSESFGEIEDL